MKQKNSTSKIHSTSFINTTSTQRPKIDSFGELLRQRRIYDLKKTLRQFCKDTSSEPSYISRIERGILTAPHTKNKLIELLDKYELYESHFNMYNLAFALARESISPY